MDRDGAPDTGRLGACEGNRGGDRAGPQCVGDKVSTAEEVAREFVGGDAALRIVIASDLAALLERYAADVAAERDAALAALAKVREECDDGRCPSAQHERIAASQMIPMHEHRKALAQVAALRDALASVATCGHCSFCKRISDAALAAQAQVAALRDALGMMNIAMRARGLDPAEYLRCMLLDAFADTAAAAAAHDAKVRAEGIREGMERAAVIARTAPSKPTGQQWSSDQAGLTAEQIRAAAAEVKP